MTQAWLVEAVDPLLFRDARPFGPASIARSVPLPPPSALAGAARTRSGTRGGRPFEEGSAAELLQNAVRGPQLVRVRADGALDWLFPCPADATAWRGEGEARALTRSVPLDLGRAAASVSRAGGPLPAGPPRTRTDKPHALLPLWSHGSTLAWLAADGDAPPWATPEAIDGVELPIEEPRMHVGIEPGRQTADDGALFETEGRSWSWPERPRRSAARLAMLVHTDLPMDEGASVLGGERRVATWRRVDAPAPQIPQEVITSARAGFVRLVLATPGLFTRGFPPTAAALTPPGGPAVEARVVSCIVGDPIVTSGWDLAQGKPKPTRHLAPAGSVLFLALGGDAAAREAWARAAWLQPLSDDPQAARDGFGVALLGTWSGQPVPLGGS